VSRIGLGCACTTCSCAPQLGSFGRLSGILIEDGTYVDEPGCTAANPGFCNWSLRLGMSVNSQPDLGPLIVDDREAQVLQEAFGEPATRGIWAFGRDWGCQQFLSVISDSTGCFTNLSREMIGAV
jgi:hypothetical protein